MQQHSSPLPYPQFKKKSLSLQTRSLPGLHFGVSTETDKCIRRDLGPRWGQPLSSQSQGVFHSLRSTDTHTVSGFMAQRLITCFTWSGSWIRNIWPSQQSGRGIDGRRCARNDLLSVSAIVDRIAAARGDYLYLSWRERAPRRVNSWRQMERCCRRFSRKVSGSLHAIAINLLRFCNCPNGISGRRTDNYRIWPGSEEPLICGTGHQSAPGSVRAELRAFNGPGHLVWAVPSRWRARGSRKAYDSERWEYGFVCHRDVGRQRLSRMQGVRIGNTAWR